MTTTYNRQSVHIIDWFEPDFLARPFHPIPAQLNAAHEVAKHVSRYLPSRISIVLSPSHFKNIPHQVIAIGDETLCLVQNVEFPRNKGGSIKFGLSELQAILKVGLELAQRLMPDVYEPLVESPTGPNNREKSFLLRRKDAALTP